MSENLRDKKSKLMGESYAHVRGRYFRLIGDSEDYFRDRIKSERAPTHKQFVEAIIRIEKRNESQ